jgi:hypothetical protein
MVYIKSIQKLKIACIVSTFEASELVCKLGFTTDIVKYYEF